MGGKRTLEERVVNVTKRPNQPPVSRLSPEYVRDDLVAVPPELGPVDAWVGRAWPLKAEALSLK